MTISCDECTNRPECLEKGHCAFGNKVLPITVAPTLDKNDGGPAFPCEQGSTPEGGWNQTFESGMTLRDYFAAKALQGASACPNVDYSSVERAAADFYRMADAMLKERAK